VNAREAVQVRDIFGLFLRDGSLDATLAEMRQRGWRMKSWTTREVRESSVAVIDRVTPLYWLRGFDDELC
jgi:hypothetical protein